MDKSLKNTGRRNFLLAAAATMPGLAVPGTTQREGGSTDAVSRERVKDSYPKPSHPLKWTKLGLAIEPTEEWEEGYIQNFNSPAEPLGNGRWRIWYGVNPPAPHQPNIAIAEGEPGKRMTKHQAVLTEESPADAPLAIGNLPAGWRPVQPVHIRLNDGRHRLYFWVHAPKYRIVRLLAADSSDGRRYTVIDPYHPCVAHFHDRAVEFEGVTPSGLKLSGKSAELKQRFPRPAHEPPVAPELICNDGTSIYQLPDGSFEMFAISLISLEKGDPRWASNDNLAGYVRVIDRLVSKDGLQWSGRQTVVKPDALDPIDQQFYYLNVTHTKKGRVGMLGHYRVKDQTMDLEWCYSKDGIHWERPYRNRPWLARGWPDAPDCYAIYPGTSIVADQNRWWLFYTGCNYIHNHKQSYGEPRSVVMAASTQSLWEVD